MTYPPTLGTEWCACGSENSNSAVRLGWGREQLGRCSLSESQILAHTFDSPSLTYTHIQSADVRTHMLLLSIAWWRSIGAVCHTLALTWPLLSTDGFTLALQGWHTHTHTHTHRLNHLFLVCFFKNISLEGVKERERTEECQPADTTTSYIPPSASSSSSSLLHHMRKIFEEL